MVCVFVCLSVCQSTQHLTSPTFIRAANDTTYFTVDEDQKICAVFSVAKIERFLLTAEKSTMFVCQGTIIRVCVHFMRNSYACAFMRNYLCVFPCVYTRRVPRVPHFSAFHSVIVPTILPPPHSVSGAAVQCSQSALQRGAGQGEGSWGLREEEGQRSVSVGGRGF